MLVNTNVYDNQASGVCSHCYSLNFHPAPRCMWNVSSHMLPYVCSHVSQFGGGLGIQAGGTATLAYTNVYENQATRNFGVHFARL